MDQIIIAAECPLSDGCYRQLLDHSGNDHILIAASVFSDDNRLILNYIFKIKSVCGCCQDNTAQSSK